MGSCHFSFPASLAAASSFAPLGPPVERLEYKPTNSSLNVVNFSNWNPPKQKKETVKGHPAGGPIDQTAWPRRSRAEGRRPELQPRGHHKGVGPARGQKLRLRTAERPATNKPLAVPSTDFTDRFLFRPTPVVLLQSAIQWLAFRVALVFLQNQVKGVLAPRENRLRRG